MFKGAAHVKFLFTHAIGIGIIYSVISAFFGSRMSYLGQDEESASVYRLNDYTQIWITRAPHGMNITLGYLPGKASPTSLTVGCSAGIKFLVVETDHLLEAIKDRVIIEELVAFALDKKLSTVPYSIEIALHEAEYPEHSKTVQVIYHHMYGRKVQFISGYEGKFIRMPLGIYNKMTGILRQEAAIPRSVNG